MSNNAGPYNFKHDYAQINDIRIHYVSHGKGKLILFVHGFPSFWYMWQKQLIEFGKDYQAVAMDMRGYNLSSKPDDVKQYQAKYLIEDLRALAEHLGHKKFILVAHDWGGAVAWPFANQYPEYLEKLIIINSPHPNIFAKLLATNKEQQTASQYMLFFQSLEAETVLSENDYAMLFDVIITPGMDFTKQDRKMYIDAWSQPGALTGSLNYYRAAALTPPEINNNGALKGLTEKMPGKVMVNVPTMVIWGEKDTALTLHNLEGLENYVADLTIKKISDGSHWVVSENPEHINSMIREFITAV
jgi:pimeloyl-ACP methyl ester carboxylesterase